VSRLRLERPRPSDNHMRLVDRSIDSRDARCRLNESLWCAGCSSLPLKNNERHGEPRDSSFLFFFCFEQNAAEIARVACAARLGHRFRPEDTKTAALIRGLRPGKQERSVCKRGRPCLRTRISQWIRFFRDVQFIITYRYVGRNVEESEKEIGTESR
jgi:hypothetical protein